LQLENYSQSLESIKGKLDNSEEITVDDLAKFNIDIKKSWLDENKVFEYKGHEDEIREALKEVYDSTIVEYLNLLSLKQKFTAEIYSS
jgi:hypothetical protein